MLNDININQQLTMNKFKSKLKLLGYALLVALALIGVGVVGVPVPPTNKKEDKIEIVTEISDAEEAEEEAIEFEQKK